MFCSKCGNKVIDEMLYCDRCGNKLPVRTNPPTNLESTFENQNNYNTSNGFESQNTNPFATQTYNDNTNPFAPQTSNDNTNPFASPTSNDNTSPFAPQTFNNNVNPFTPQNFNNNVNPFAPQDINNNSNPFMPQDVSATSNAFQTSNNEEQNKKVNKNTKKTDRKNIEKTTKKKGKKVKLILALIFLLIVLATGIYLGLKLVANGIIDLKAWGLVEKEDDLSQSIQEILNNNNIKNSITYKGYQLIPDFDYDITFQNEKIFLNIDGTVASIEYHSDVSYNDMIKKSAALKEDMQRAIGNNYYVGDPNSLYINEKQYTELIVYDANWKPFSKVFYTGEKGGLGTWIVSIAPVDYDKYEDVLKVILNAKKTTKVYSTYANELSLPNVSKLEQMSIEDGISNEVSGNVSGDSGEIISEN